MDDAGMALVPEAYKTEDNQAVFDAHETFDSFMGDMLAKNGQVSTLSTELETAKKGLEGTVRLPGEDATDEDRAAYLKAIGVPEDVSGYGIENAEKTLGGKEYLEAMLKAGLTPAQVKEQLQASALIEKSVKEQTVAAQTKAVAEYKESLGEKADLTFGLAQHGIESFFADNDAKETISAEIMKNPALIKAYAKMGAIIKEKPMILSMGNGGSKGGNIYETMKGLE